MGSRYGRGPSPTRRYGHSARASTGGLDLHQPPEYENYYNPRSSRDAFQNPRSSAERVLPPRSAPRHQNTLPLRRNPDDYYVPPRRTLEPITTTRRGQPLTVAPPASSSRHHPSVSSAVDIRGGDEEFYVQPAGGSQHHHHRHYSGGGQDMNQYLMVNRSDRDRRDRNAYRTNIYPQQYTQPPVRARRDKDDQDYGYEYTNKQEQVYRDTAPRPRARRESDSGTRERPHSITGMDDIYNQRGSSSYRDGPPVTTRGFSKIDRNGSIRHEYRYPKEPERQRESSLTRSSQGLDDSARRRTTRAPVHVHQDSNDGYSSNIEDRSHDRHRHSQHRRSESNDRDYNRGASTLHRSESHDRHHRKSHRHHRDGSEDRYARHDRGEESERERDREHDRDRRHRDSRREKQGESGLGEGIAIGAAGATAAGVIAEGVKSRRERDSSDNDSDSRRKGHSHENSRSVAVAEASPSSNESNDEERRERRRRRRREREERERAEAASKRQDEPSSPDDVRHASIDSNGHLPVPLPHEGEERRRRKVHRHHRRTSDQPSQSSESSADIAARDSRDPREHRSSRVRVVSPAKEPEPKPKGILRAPREKFPEDPAPIREGVAPLKEAGKKGIPPNARWTKIDRRLVNPEALEQGNERFEERLEYVIVLRVLSKEEIEGYAQRTKDIRGTHYYPVNKPFRRSNF